MINDIPNTNSFLNLSTQPQSWSPAVSNTIKEGGHLSDGGFLSFVYQSVDLWLQMGMRSVYLEP